MSLDAPSKIEISLRLYHDLQVQLAYSLKSDAEAGGFIVKSLHGHFGLIAEQFGEDREIVIEPNEDMYQGEEYFGTAHSHPKTDTFSIGDVASYLSDDTELIMTLIGADSSINLAIKIPDITKKGSFRDELEAKYPPHEIKEGKSDFQKALPQVADDYGFLFYRAEDKDENILTLQNTSILGEKINISSGTDTAEDLAESIGLQGLKDLPENLSSKKLPKKDKDISQMTPKEKLQILSDKGVKIGDMQGDESGYEDTTSEGKREDPSDAVSSYQELFMNFLNSQMDMLAQAIDMSSRINDPSIKKVVDDINKDLIAVTEKARGLSEHFTQAETSEIIQR